MKIYRVYAKYTSYCYIDVEAESEEDAYEKASEIDGGDFISDDEKNYYDDSWNLYDCEKYCEEL